MRGGGSPCAIAARSATAQPHEPAGVGTDDHHLVAERLDHARVRRQRLLDGLDEALDRRQRLLVAALHRQARIAGQVGEHDRHAHAPRLRSALGEVGLHVPDHVLLDEVAEQPVVHVAQQRHDERDQLARQPLHLLGDLHVGHALAHQRLVHVQVDQPHLGFGDLRDRLPVHARELQERHRRQPRVEHRGDVLHHLHVLLGHQRRRRRAEPHRAEDALDQRLFQPALARHLAQRVARLGAAQQVLDRPDRQLAVVAGALDLLQRVPARAQASDHAHVRSRRRRPAALIARHETLLHPAFDRRHRHAGAHGHLRERRLGRLARRILRGFSHSKATRRAFPFPAV